MKNDFFNLSAEEQAAFIQQAGDKLDISDLIIEKDLWICWVLEKIFELPIQMVFKGGTSLSKAFGLIKRFSEDCDVTIDYRNFKLDLDLENSSRTYLKKISHELKAKLKTYIMEVVLPYLREQASKKFPEKIIEITLSEDGEQLRFYYPSVINTPHVYLRDHVFIEFGVRNITEPCEKREVSPYVAQVIGEGIILPKAMVNTLSPIRTFWEKATLIHVECHRPEQKACLDPSTPIKSHPTSRLSRHWYDVLMLKKSWVGEKALLNDEVLKSVIEHKKAFFNTIHANYDDCLAGKFRLIPTDVYLKNLEKDFTQMISAGMFYELPPKFDLMMNELRMLESIINKH